MKNFLHVSAFVLMSATAATAATQAELTAIQQYAPDVTMAELDAAGDSVVASILLQINSGESESDIRQAVQASLEPTNAAMSTSDYVNESNLVTIQAYAPDATLADLAAMGDEAVASMLAIISGGDSESEKREAVAAMFETSVGGGMATADFANESNLVTIQQIVPEVTMNDLLNAGNERIAAILNEISSGENSSETRDTVKAMLGM
ncbi:MULTISPECIES: hypothetical protein [unclassified Marinovum]